jgi:hypothetical protein
MSVDLVSASRLPQLLKRDQTAAARCKVILGAKRGGRDTTRRDGRGGIDEFLPDEGKTADMTMP